MIRLRRYFHGLAGSITDVKSVTGSRIGPGRGRRGPGLGKLPSKPTKSTRELSVVASVGLKSRVLGLGSQDQDVTKDVGSEVPLWGQDRVIPLVVPSRVGWG